MTRVSHMVFWLVAVIVLIAVSAMPSGAEAHEGHRHPSAALAVPVSLEKAPVALAAHAVKAVAITALRAPARMGVASACDGLCCGPACHAGTSCCTGAGLAAESAISAPPRRSAEPALARALPARTDVVPEALPEPPRPFA